MRQKMEILSKDAGLESVQILGPDGTVLVDTPDPGAEGKRYAYLDLDLSEWQEALAGQPAIHAALQGQGRAAFQGGLCADL